MKPQIKTNEKKRLYLIEKNIIYSQRNIKTIKTLILKILKTWMAKGIKRTKLSEFDNSWMIVLKRVWKSQKEISKTLGCSKTVIYNYLKSPNKQVGWLGFIAYQPL